MAGVCYVEHEDIWCLIIFVALMIAPNSLSKALPGGVPPKMGLWLTRAALGQPVPGKAVSRPGMGI